MYLWKNEVITDKRSAAEIVLFKRGKRWWDSDFVLFNTNHVLYFIPNQTDQKTPSWYTMWYRCKLLLIASDRYSLQSHSVLCTSHYKSQMKRETQWMLCLCYGLISSGEHGFFPCDKSSVKRFSGKWLKRSTVPFFSRTLVTASIWIAGTANNNRDNLWFSLSLYTLPVYSTSNECVLSKLQAIIRKLFFIFE